MFQESTSLRMVVFRFPPSAINLDDLGDHLKFTRLYPRSEVALISPIYNDISRVLLYSSYITHVCSYELMEKLIVPCLNVAPSSAIPGCLIAFHVYSLHAQYVPEVGATK